MRRLLLSTLLVALPTVSLADPEQVAEARRGYFALVGLEFGPLAAMAKGELPYDAEAAQAHAADLVTLTRYNPGDLLTPGTSATELPGKTRAAAQIWQDMPGYQAKGAAFLEAVAALNEAAGAGQAALAPAVGKVGGTCKGCHEDYRLKDF
ncbi:MAG: cytochrome c [Cereibacter changlensis]